MKIKQINGETIKYNLQNLKQLVFEVTDMCNLRCSYCGYSHIYQGYDKRNEKMLPFGKARLVMDYLIELWKKNSVSTVIYPVTVSFYGGEPLMNISFIKKTIDYLKEVKNTGKVFSYSMTTNAVLLDKYMDYLAENEFRLLISLDGDEFAQSYRMNHSGKNSFKKVFKNVKLLQNTYPQYFQKNVAFNSVLHNRNDVFTTHRFIKGNFDKSTHISPLNNSGIRPDKISEFRKMYLNITDNINHSENCETIESEIFTESPRIMDLVRYIYQNSGNVFNSYNSFFIDETKLDVPLTGTCTPFSKKMFVTVNGKILPCERVDHCFSLGQIENRTFKPDFDFIANQHNKYTSKFIRQCKQCAIIGQCSQCVYQIDDIHQEDAVCYGFCTKKELERRNMENIEILRKCPQYYKKILDEVTIKA